MARKSIRDFSGGLVTYQSELDLADNQFQSFENIINTRRGSVVKKGNFSTNSATLTSASDTSTEFLRYRTEKDGSNNDTSTEWWVVANNEIVSRSDVNSGTGGSWTTVNTYSGLGSECITEGALTGSGGGDEWAFGSGWEYTTSPPLVASYGGSAVGAMTQTSAAMAIALEKNKIYKLQFALVSIGGGGKASITIKNQGLTETYIALTSYSAGTHTVYFSPQTSGGGIGFYAADEDGSATETFRINTVTIKECAKHDLLIHNQILRISDGSFNSSNNSKWYGHIKRDAFGQGLTDTHYRFKTPPMSATINAWTLEDTELTPPTVVPMKYAFDQNDDINAANEVGIFVYYPSASLQFMTDVAAGTFDNKDKYTVTFIYDYVQESELGREAGGSIGVFPENDISGGRVPGIQLVLDTGSSLANWNKRITGINLYWQPADDVDWYLVSTYDIQDGFADDPRALNSATTSIVRGVGNTVSNPGYWIPCLEPYGATANDTHDLSDTYGDHSATVLKGSSNWSGSTGFATDKAVIVTTANISSNTVALFSAELEKPTTYIANIKSISSADLTTGSVSGSAVDWGNWQGEGYSEWPTDIDLSAYTAFVATISTDKVATWYIPNDGLKLATYNSLTGRAAETRLKPIKWNTSAVVGNKAFYANIDFKDENDQTLREKNRIVFTDNFKLDETVVGTKFVDIGKNDGDEITALHSAQGRLYVFKTRNIYIYRIQSAQSVNFILERHIAGVGCLHKHAVVDTPYGICFADHRQVSLIRGTELSELSLLIRGTYQGLDREVNRGALALGYHPFINTLVVNYSYNAVIMYAYNFDTQSWAKLNSFNNSGQFQSQFTIDENQELESFNTKTNNVQNLFLTTNSDTASTLLLKTKRFDFGFPEKFKRFTKLYITYKSSSGTNAAFKIYIDGDSTEVMTESMDNHTSVQTYSAIINQLGKTIEVEVYGTTSNIRIEGIDIDYDIEGSNP